MKSLFLKPFSYLYRVVIAVRNHFYDVGIFRIRKLPMPVISVGNITAGGSGKTPLVRFLCEKLTGKGFVPAVLSRGYKRKDKTNIIFRSSDETNLTVDRIGDEPYMLSQQLNDTIFGISPDRYKAGIEVLKKYKPDLFILDDGFQHRKLYRDINIVIIDGSNILPYRDCLPAGMLREPLKNLKRADIIIIKDENEGDNKYMRRIYSYIPPQAIVFKIKTVPSKLVDYNSGEEKSLDSLRGKSAVSFCGLGNNENFQNMLIESGVKLLSSFVYRDHHDYLQEDIDKMKAALKTCNGELAVTTMKDMVKLKKFKIDFPLYYLDIDYEFNCDEQAVLISLITGKLNRTAI
ncbi:MAG: tetraacyldisaccharide 4'-kinase [candidate division Zixibacteria bacterium]|nr:tetraacyldisaccharide 4'-kinase [candidate division Zixibacteria bacterium]